MMTYPGRSLHSRDRIFMVEFLVPHFHWTLQIEFHTEAPRVSSASNHENSPRQSHMCLP